MNRLIPLIIIILSIAVGVVYVLPDYNQVNELRAEESVLDDGLVKATEAESIRQNLQEKLDTISKEQYRILDLALPQTFDDIRLANDLQGIARSHGIDIGNINFNESNQDKTSDTNGNPILQVAQIQETKISFDVTATYQVFLSFIADLQDSLQLMDLTEINFGEANEGEYSFSVSFKTYSLSDKSS
ncbi:MAG TPA: hypothetical protein ENI66_01730 [Candidatus Yonathbacteria bacterium]|nr:hypothetical protein [Candidatus Yonathbacteria bacterium]